MKENFKKAYREVFEILKYMPEEDVKKIPNEIILTFKTKMDQNYKFEIDVSKELKEQNLLEETKDILANLARDYWATPEQKQRIIVIENKERRLIEEEKRKKYNPDNIFGNKENIVDSSLKQAENSNYKTDENEIKEDFESNIIIAKNWKQKIIEFIKKIFKK